MNVLSKSDITNLLVLLKRSATQSLFYLYDAKQIKSQKYYSKHLRNKYSESPTELRKKLIMVQN